MGAQYHVAYPVIIRASFGMYGSYPAIIIRGMYLVSPTSMQCLTMFYA